jgi:hypothetical protein
MKETRRLQRDGAFNAPIRHKESEGPQRVVKTPRVRPIFFFQRGIVKRSPALFRLGSRRSRVQRSSAALRHRELKSRQRYCRNYKGAYHETALQNYIVKWGNIMRSRDYIAGGPLERNIKSQSQIAGDLG